MEATCVQKKIVIADDHVSVREGLIQMVDDDEAIFVCAAVSNGVQLIKAVANYQPELVVTDIRMPELGGLEAGMEIKKQFGATALLAYMAEESEYLFLKLLEAGFDGIVLKRASKNETLLGIHSILNGREYFCHTAEEKINNLIRKKMYNPRRKTIKPTLNDRELLVLQFICKGQTSRKIAEAMQLSERTVEGYREGLLRKTNCLNVAGLVSYAFGSGLIRDL